MKKLILLFAAYSLIFTGFASAFWTNSDALERTDHAVRVDHRGNQSQVTIEETVTNNTGAAQTYRYLAPISGATGINLYQDANGWNYQSLNGPTLLSTLWEEGQRDLLQLGSYHDQAVLFSEEISLAPGVSTDIKLKYNLTPETKNGTSVLTVDIGDRLASSSFFSSFNLVGNNRHFVPPLALKGEHLTEGSNTSWFYEGNDYQSDQPLTWLWSSAEKPQLSYRYQDFDYHLQLESAPSPITWDTVTILVDQSGSMFGGRWEQSQILVKEFLKNIPGNTKIRVGFFDNEISWFHENSVPNNATEQKKFFDWWAAQVPAGHTDWSLLQEVLRDLQLDQGALSKSAGLIVGDFSQFEIEGDDYFNLKSFRRSLLLDFAQNPVTQTWSRLNDGQYFELLSEDEDLIQWPFVWEKWKSLHLPKNPPSLSGHQDIFPAEINYFVPGQSLLWLSRSQTKDSHPLFESASFVPHLWGLRSEAHDLRREAITNSSDDFVPTWKRIWGLESITVPGPLPFTQNGKPVAQIEPGTWSTADFDALFPIKAGIEVAPGSVAERDLFYFFPDLLGRALSLGEDVSFCGQNRCVQLDDYGETTPEEMHKLDWRGPLKAHWSNDYLLDLARENIVTINPFGDHRLDQPITRGEFILWLTKWYFGTDFTERTAPIGDPRFTDIQDEDTELAEAIYLLRRKGVIQGYPDGTVKPDRPLARAEAVKILLALDGYQAKEVTETLPFNDIKGWEIPWVYRAHQIGLVQGYGNNTFKPFQSLTRGEGIKLIASFD